jgi:outer membrane protein assembly factor BamB
MGAFHGDNQRTGRSTSLGPIAPEAVWTFSTGGSINASPVMGADGTVYLGGTDGCLYALNRDGALKWTFRADESIYATPAVSEEGTVHFADLSGKFYAVRPDGSLKWSAVLPDGSDRRVVAAPVLDSKGRSYVVSWNNWLYCLDADGAIVRQAYLGGMVSAAPVSDSADNVYVASLDSVETQSLCVWKFPPGSSQAAWRFKEYLGIDRNRVISSPAIDLDRGRLYVGAARTADGLLLAVNLADGGLAFRATFPRGVVSSPAIGPTGEIYVGCLDGKLYAVNPLDGAVRWSFAATGSYIMGSPSVDGAGNVYVGDSDGTVYALSEGGGEWWRYSSEGNIVSAPAVDAQGRLYVTSCDKKLYALDNSAQVKTLCVPHAADGATGAGRYQSTIRVLNQGPDSQVQVEFFDPLGRPLKAVQLAGRSTSAAALLLKKGESAAVRTQTGSELRVGYARVRGGPGLAATGMVSYAEQGVTLYEAGVPTASGLEDFSLIVDAAGRRQIGVAVVNTGGQAAKVVFRLYDAAFGLIATRTAADLIGEPGLLPGAHLARFADELFPEIREQKLVRGTISVASDQPLAAVSMCQQDDPKLNFPAEVPTTSAWPVLPGRADAERANSGNTVFYFPQIACGQTSAMRASTRLWLTNTNQDADVLVAFFRPDGSAWPVTLAGQAPSSAVQFRLKRGEVAGFETTDEGSLEVGYARVATTSGVAGAAVFSYSADGVDLFDTWVPAVEGSSGFTLFFDTADASRNTGVALVNVGAVRANVTLRLYDQAFRFLAARTSPELDPLAESGRHLARYATELFPEIRAQGVAGGVITVESDQPLAAIGLVQQDDPSLAFPAEVYRLIAIPVVEGRPDK